MKLKFILKTISPGDKELAKKSLQGLICMYMHHRDIVHPFHGWPDGTISWFIDEKQKQDYESGKYKHRWYSITIKKL